MPLPVPARRPQAPHLTLVRFGASVPANTTSRAPTRTMPNASMFDTLQQMRQAALRGARDMRVRGVVEELCKNIPQGDYTSEVLACYYWVCQHIRYMRDIAGVEFLKDPEKVITSGSGDCDDMATLLASMLMACGNTCHFAVWAFGRNGPHPRWSHVSVQVQTPSGDITLDPVANRITREMHARTYKRAKVPVTSGPMTADAGVGLAGVGSSSNHYSVYDYHRGVYDYYEGPKTALPPTGKYRPARHRSAHGIAPEDVAAKLPFGAKKVGEGKMPRGMIASTMGALDMRPSSFWWGVIAGVGGVFAYRELRRRRII